MPRPTPAWDDLPGPVRNEATALAVAGKSSRAVADFIATKGYKLHFTSVARYMRRTIRPAIERGAKLQQLQTQSEKSADQAQQSALTTRQRLAEDVIYQAFTKQKERLERAIDHSLKHGDIADYARCEAVNGHTIERMARAMQHPGFAPAAQQSTTVNMLVVVPGTELTAAPVTDAEVIEIDPIRK